MNIQVIEQVINSRRFLSRWGGMYSELTLTWRMHTSFIITEENKLKEKKKSLQMQVYFCYWEVEWFPIWWFLFSPGIFWPEYLLRAMRKGGDVIIALERVNEMRNRNWAECSRILKQQGEYSYVWLSWLHFNTNPGGFGNPEPLLSYP